MLPDVVADSAVPAVVVDPMLDGVGDSLVPVETLVVGADVVELVVLDVVEPVVLDVVEPVVLDVVEPVVLDVVEPVVLDVVEPVVLDVVEPVVLDVAPVPDVFVEAVTTPLLKSCSFAISVFIGSIESDGNLQLTVLEIPILVAVTSAVAPSGLFGCRRDCTIVTHILACTFKPLMLFTAIDPSGCSKTSNDTNLSRLSWSTSLLSMVLTNLSARFS